MCFNGLMSVNIFSHTQFFFHESHFSSGFNLYLLTYLMFYEGIICTFKGMLRMLFYLTQNFCCQIHQTWLGINIKEEERREERDTENCLKVMAVESSSDYKSFLSPFCHNCFSTILYGVMIILNRTAIREESNLYWQNRTSTEFHV